MIDDMLSNKKIIPTVTELFIRSTKLNISLAFFSQSYFVVPKNIRLNSTKFHYENSKQKRTSTIIQRIIIHQILTLKTF